MCLDFSSLARREESGGHAECMDVFIEDPKATAERIAGTTLCPPLPLSSSLTLVHSPHPYVSLLSSCRRGKTPHQLASEPVSRSAGQSALQRALPITIWLFSCWFAPLFPLHKCRDLPSGGFKPIRRFEGPYHMKYFIQILRINKRSRDLKFPVV